MVTYFPVLLILRRWARMPIPIFQLRIMFWFLNPVVNNCRMSANRGWCILDSFLLDLGSVMSAFPWMPHSEMYILKINNLIKKRMFSTNTHYLLTGWPFSSLNIVLIMLVCSTSVMLILDGACSVIMAAFYLFKIASGGNHIPAKAEWALLYEKNTHAC